MSKKSEWKTKCLEIIPPRLVLGAYRDVIDAINGSESVFSIDEVKKELTDWLKGFDEMGPVALDAYRCVTVLPTIIASLAETGLIKRRDDGRFKKSEDLQDFWDLTKKVRTSVEKAIRWGIYYTIIQKRIKRYLSSDDLIDSLTPSQQELVDILERIAVYRTGKWRRILRQKDDSWIIREQPERRGTPPSPIKDASQKIMHVLSLFSESGDTEVDTRRIAEKVRSVDLESIERFLSRLHFTKQNGRWLLPREIIEAPHKLVEEIEMAGRLPAHQAELDCLRLLDSRILSATEMIGLTGIDKSTISRALKRLSADDFIELTGKKGPFGEVYYTTVCGNCWLGKGKEECKDETIADIERMLKSRKLKPVTVDWNDFSNQALNQLALSLASSEVEKLIKQDVKESMKLWETLLMPQIDKILDALETRALRMVSEEGFIDEERIYELADERGKMLPMLYFLGMKHVLGTKQIRKGMEIYFKEKARPGGKGKSEK